METQNNKPEWLLTLEESVKLFESTNQPTNQSSGPLSLDQAFAQTDALSIGEPTDLERSIGKQILASKSINAYIIDCGERFPDFLAAFAHAPLDIVTFGVFLVEAGRLMGLDEANRANGDPAYPTGLNQGEGGR